MSGEQGPPLHGVAAAALESARWEKVSSGHRSQVWKASFDDDRPELAVKCAAPTSADTPDAAAARAEAVALIHAEAARLIWVADHLGGRGVGIPGVVAVSESDDPDPILVTEWLEGTTDPRLMRSPDAAVEAFARTLASLHEASRRIDLADCPFDASLDARLDAAAARVEVGLVDTTRLADPFNRYTATALLDRVRQMADAATPPEPIDLVLVHGDLCVTNVVFDPAYSTTVGALDWSHAGVGDRTQDLAITARSLSRNLSGEVLPDFFGAYGLSDPDLLRIETYVALEELF